MAKPKTLISIDIQHPNVFGANLHKVEELATNMGCNFNFILGNTANIEIEQTDLLFIDTWHAYKQLKMELNKHYSKVNKYIILHDTTTYEFNDETAYESSFGFYGDGKGLWPAVDEFLNEHKEWKIHERFINNNGLTILKKN
jgi:hypothetical protein